ncbi:MAG: UMP kinase [Nanoarchaeota archaeon]|nr:UMP kinase [Nanoarchaeota archaeon]
MASKKVIVISLGGSLIVPEKIDFIFLDKLKKTLEKYYKKYKFVIICGGGSIARKYIEALKHENKIEKELSLAGIRATRMNALFLMQFFGKEANEVLPMDMKEVESNLHKNNAVICGALRYEDKSTSDSTAAKLANHFKSEFINMTNVEGLYNSNPVIHKDAKFIPLISWKSFEKRANGIKHKPGQHFVLDQHASTLIRKHKIKTYIIGKNLKNLQGILDNKSFKGTIIQG